MFKEAIIPLMFPPGDDCGEFKSMRLSGVSTGSLAVDDPEEMGCRRELRATRLLDRNDEATRGRGQPH